MKRRDVLKLAALPAATAIPLLAPANAASRRASASKPVREANVPTPSPVVTTTAGRVQGLIKDGILAFKGVRYGAAPIGKRRFMPPEPAEPWTTIYDATDYGAPAM